MNEIIHIIQILLNILIILSPVFTFGYLFYENSKTTGIIYSNQEIDNKIDNTILNEFNENEIINNYSSNDMLKIKYKRLL